MEIKPNLEDLSEEEFYNLVMKMLEGIENTLDRTKEKLKDTLDYIDNRNRLVTFYKKYDTDYYSKLN